LPTRISRSDLRLLVLGWQGFGHRLNSAFEFGQIVINGGLQDRVVCVEVTVR
jgi:hypothetical protein